MKKFMFFRDLPLLNSGFISDNSMKPPLDKAGSVEGQLFGSKPQDDTVIVDIEDPALPTQTTIVNIEPEAEPIVITVVENGNKTNDGKFYLIVIYNIL